MNSEFLAAIIPMLMRGLKVTMQIALIGIGLGFVLGSLSGYALQSKNRLARGIANIYMWIIRGTPLVVQALYVFFAFQRRAGKRGYRTAGSRYGIGTYK